MEQEKEPSKKRPHWWKRLWGWTEFGKKSGWEWLQLLVVPFALVVISFLFTAQQDQCQQQIEQQRVEAERELEEQLAQDEALQSYLDQMSGLLLEKDLRTSDKDSEVRTLARARTLTVLGPNGKLYTRPDGLWALGARYYLLTLTGPSRSPHVS